MMRWLRVLLWVTIWSLSGLTIQICSSFLVSSPIDSPMTRASRLSLITHSIGKPADDFHSRQQPSSPARHPRQSGIFKKIRRSLWNKIRYVLAVVSLSIALWGGPLVNEASAVITVLPGTGGITQHASKQDSVYKRPDVERQQSKKTKSIEKKKNARNVRTKEKRQPSNAMKVKGEKVDFGVPSILSRLETPSSKNRSMKSSTLTISKQSKPKKQEITAESESRRVLFDAAKVVVVTGSGVILGLQTSKTQRQEDSTGDTKTQIGSTITGLKEESVKVLFKGREYAGTVATKVSEQGEIVKQVVAEEWKRSGELGTGSVSTKVSEQSEILKQVVAEEWKRSGEIVS